MSRPPDAWLGGVCAATARRLGWNTLGLRAAAVLVLLVWPLLTIVTYVIAAWCLDRQPKVSADPAMDEWDRRLADLDRQLRH